jgi:hypothetical protein
VLALYPTGAHWDDDPRRPTDELVASAWEIAAVLTSSVASAWLWHRGAGTGLSVDSIRLSPVTVGGLPWPGGDLSPAVAALQVGDVRSCSTAVADAYGIADAVALDRWWSALLERIETRQPSTA